jgi:hypothetical protein
LECRDDAASGVVTGVREVLDELGLADGRGDDTTVITEEETCNRRYVRAILKNGLQNRVVPPMAKKTADSKVVKFIVTGTRSTDVEPDVE